MFFLWIWMDRVLAIWHGPITCCHFNRNNHNNVTHTMKLPFKLHCRIGRRWMRCSDIVNFIVFTLACESEHKMHTMFMCCVTVVDATFNSDPIDRCLSLWIAVVLALYYSSFNRTQRLTLKYDQCAIFSYWGIDFNKKRCEEERKKHVVALISKGKGGECPSYAYTYLIHIAVSPQHLK